MKNTIVLVNLWGLGDLVSTLSLVKKNRDRSFHLITPHKKKTISELMSAFEMDSKISFFSNKLKIILIFEIIRNIVLGRTIIFTAPLEKKSRLLANFFSRFYSKTVLVKEHGNIYDLNEKINLNNYP